jgi:hypothetical protein
LFLWKRKKEKRAKPGKGAKPGKATLGKSINEANIISNISKRQK